MTRSGEDAGRANCPPCILAAFFRQMRMTRLWRVALLVLVAVLLQAVSVQAVTPGRAGLVVRLSDATIITRCVAFQEERISGIELLERSGLEFTIASDPAFGAFVCKIDGEGCPADNCLCAYPPDYWRYWLLIDGDWQVSPVGASSRVLRDGDVDGWSWGSGEAGAPATFPAITFADICPSVQGNTIYLPMIAG